ncbi:MAG: hypothetical protein LBT39_02660 [Treponema sp.]|jgi:hypothetical protein|nr:hypothetical protein [Treponema sp.]
MDEMGESLLRLLPPVLRARDFRLYTQGRGPGAGGRSGEGRLVDLWQSGGRAILGHTPAGVLRELKNSASRGLFAPFPHPLEGRLAKALSRLFPNRVFRFYEDRSSLDKALAAAGFPRTGPFPDPAFPPAPDTPDEAPCVSLWRPFLEDSALSPIGSPEASILVPVFPWPLSPWVLALDRSLDDRFAPSELVSPVLLAGAARAFYDLIAAGKRGGRPVYPKINRALYGTPGPWRCRGIYLTFLPLQGPAPAAEATPLAWETLFRRFLEGGFLIPPSPQDPLILPGSLSPGEETALAALLRSCISFSA